MQQGEGGGGGGSSSRRRRRRRKRRRGEGRRAGGAEEGRSAREKWIGSAESLGRRREEGGRGR
jgi:hypothetical protein